MGDRLQLPGPYRCMVLLRFVGEDGRWIPSVTVRQLEAVEGPVSDFYGRLMLTVKSDGNLRRIAEKASFVAAPIDLACPSQDHMEENIVVLKKVSTVR